MPQKRISYDRSLACNRLLAQTPSIGIATKIEAGATALPHRTLLSMPIWLPSTIPDRDSSFV